MLTWDIQPDLASQLRPAQPHSYVMTHILSCVVGVINLDRNPRTVGSRRTLATSLEESEKVLTRNQLTNQLLHFEPCRLVMWVSHGTDLALCRRERMDDAIIRISFSDLVLVGPRWSRQVL